MDSLPVEVLRIIFSFLDFDDAANLRFLTRKHVDIGAEFLITRVRFHTSKTSLARLESISEHPVFSRTVRVLVYEAALLADVKCRHEYARHFDQDHHTRDRPKEPPGDCTDRERRSFRRNKVKWTKEIYAKFDNYRTLFDAQRSLFERNIVGETLSRTIPRFTKLAYIDIDPIRRCTHLTSERFIEEFGADCASPLSGNFNRTSDQLQWMLLPKNNSDSIAKSLRRLEVNSLSPSFFSESRRETLKVAFSQLTNIEVTFKLADCDFRSGEHSRDSFHRHLSNRVFKNALSAAKKLQSISIRIDSTSPFYVDISEILSSSIWPDMESLSLTTVTSTQHNLLEMLKRQPKLTTLKLALMQLTEGSWPNTLKEMREQLKLDNFIPGGFLEDNQECWPMDLVHVPIYLDMHELHDLSTAIDFFVTDNGLEDPEVNLDDENPLVGGFEDFEEMDLVQELYGTLSEIDEMSLDEEEEEEEEESVAEDYEEFDSDTPMPDLDDTDIPDEDD